MGDPFEERTSDSTTEAPYKINPGLVRARAKELFILYYWSKEDLHTHLGIPLEDLTRWISQPTANQFCWQQERDIFESSIFQKMKERCSDEMSKGMARAMSILNRSLSEADMESMKLNSPREYRDMVAVIKELKNLINLEEGKPTSIVKNLNLTQTQVKEILTELQELDPFMDYDQSGGIN